jgi:hypothetical protein
VAQQHPTLTQHPLWHAANRAAISGLCVMALLLAAAFLNAHPAHNSAKFTASACAELLYTASPIKPTADADQPAVAGEGFTLGHRQPLAAANTQYTAPVTARAGGCFSIRAPPALT